MRRLSLLQFAVTVAGLAGVVAMAVSVAGRSVKIDAAREERQSRQAELRQEARRERIAQRRDVLARRRAARAAAEAASLAQLADKTWVVVVLGPDDQPLRGVHAEVRDGTENPIEYETNEAGELTITRQAASKKLPITVWRGVPLTWVDLTEHRTVLRFPHLLPLAVRLVDGLTGLPVPGGGVRTTSSTDGEIAFEREGDRFILPVSEYHPGEGDGQLLFIDPPPGYAHVGSVMDYVIVSPLARAMHFDVPVWPEISINVRVLDAAGEPVAGAQVGPAKIEGIGEFGYTRKTNAAGRATIQGVGLVPGERARVEASVSDRFESGETSVLTKSCRSADVEIRLPAEARARPPRQGRCGGSGTFMMRHFEAAPEGGTLTARVRVTQRDGRPASGVTVRLISDELPSVTRTTTDNDEPPDDVDEEWAIAVKTNAQGLALIEGLHPLRAARIQAYGRGFVSVERDVRIGAETDNEFVLAEQKGRTLNFRVVDAEGRAVPSARVEIRGSDYAINGRWDYDRLVGGAQHATLLTDGDGRLRVDHVNLGWARVTAALGSREGTVSIDRDADEREATITLR